ncbi:MAG: MBL fold metallo-hydrolase [Candidatus Ornithomonoglobus sp.]
MRFLGTGAGEGIPDPFCTCEVCENARRVGGKEIRARSSFRLDDEVIIDIGGDYFSQSWLLNEPLYNIRHMVFTHSHGDHLRFDVFWERHVRRAGAEFPMHIYLTEDAFKVFDDKGSPDFLSEKNIIKHRLEFYKKYRIGNYDFTPLKADHFGDFNDRGANYLVECDKFKMYYAVDSGWFPDETIQYLKNARLDIFIGELTFPVPGRTYDPEMRGHMDMEICLRHLDRLYGANIIDDHTKVYFTHIGPVGANHAQLEAYFKALGLPYDVTVAYDGLSI